MIALRKFFLLSLFFSVLVASLFSNFKSVSAVSYETVVSDVVSFTIKNDTIYAIFDSSSPQLKKSVDYGATWVSLKNFSTKISESRGLCVSEDGETILVSTYNSTNDYLYGYNGSWYLLEEGRSLHFWFSCEDNNENLYLGVYGWADAGDTLAQAPYVWNITHDLNEKTLFFNGSDWDSANKTYMHVQGLIYDNDTSYFWVLSDTASGYHDAGFGGSDIYRYDGEDWAKVYKGSYPCFVAIGLSDNYVYFGNEGDGNKAIMLKIVNDTGYITSDVANGWSYSSKAYDNDTGEDAYYSPDGYTWSPYLYLNYSGYVWGFNWFADFCDVEVDLIEVGFYDSEQWITVFNDTGLDDEWHNITFGINYMSCARIRIYNGLSNPHYEALSEFSVVEAYSFAYRTESDDIYAWSFGYGSKCNDMTYCGMVAKSDKPILYAVHGGVWLKLFTLSSISAYKGFNDVGETALDGKIYAIAYFDDGFSLIRFSDLTCKQFNNLCYPSSPSSSTTPTPSGNTFGEFMPVLISFAFLTMCIGMLKRLR